MMGITGAFSSLDINERPLNTQNGMKLPKNRSTLSLPNLTSQTRSGFSPGFIRNNYCDDDIESSDQPIDFSKKYCETKIEDKAMKTGLENGNRNCTFNKVVKSYNNTFTMYAETDLDQPTDYSLRYAEDDSDSDGCNKIAKTETAEFVQDTIKTYCTEDTPYETPFNFSTSTSMSDLRIDDKTPVDSKIETESKNPKDIRSEKIMKSEFSSGLMSPEKPVNYCEEGTPGYFSRVASCGSLNSIPVNESSKPELKEDKTCDKEPRRGNKFSSETKAVKFEEVVNYAEETPLMFSRSSSLASLDSIEQHSIHDDRSSVISDFSRLTSGLISPSELPDSPSQTIPPSPKPRKNPLLYPQVAKKKSEEPSRVPEGQKCSVFEDAVKKFKMESTPLQFSTATSLSSLIDDHEEAHSKTKNTQNARNENDKNDDLNNLDINNELSESSEDEDILAACINIGMQNNRYSQKPNTPPPPPPPINEVPNFKFPHNGDINGPRNSSQHLLITVPRSSVEVTQNGQKSDMTSDSVRTYCTEDTPAILSLAGSNSDLSLLSLHIENKIEKVEDLNAKGSLQETDERGNSNLVPETETEENRSCRSSLSCLSDASHESEKALLQECILAGMPKGSSSPIKTSVARSSSEKLTELEDPESTLLVMQKTVVDDESSDEEDKNILADCINSGMKNNRYNQHKLNPTFQNGKDNIVTQLKSSAAVKIKDKQTVMNDSVKSYYTEDTPVGLSHAGSGSDLSVLSAQVKGVGKDDLFDVNSNLSDDEDERLLMECVRYGMAKITGSAMLNHLQKVENNETRMKNYLHNDSSQRVVTEREKVDLNISVENNVSDDDSRSFSSISDESYESDQALLQECILAGMPKPRPPSAESNELTPTEKALLQQCILEGMRKCRINPKNKPIEEGSDLTEAERALLRQCILAGMPKNKNLSVGGPSAARESTELTESERLLLQQCILAGMPKGRGQQRSRQQWSTRPPRDGGEQGHTCCIHCPRNIQNRMLAARQGGRRKRYRERGQMQVREGRDVNILYVTSQILAMKKEIVDRSHEEWV